MADLVTLSAYVGPLEKSTERLLRRYWPGPLTAVFRAHGLPRTLYGPEDGVGFRISAHPIASELVRRFGWPVTSTSANRSGNRPARKVKGLREQFEGEDLLILDGGKTPGGPASTVVSLLDPAHPALIRKGAVAWKEILRTMSDQR